MSELLKSINASQILRMGTRLQSEKKAFVGLAIELANEKRRVAELEEQLKEAIKQAIYDPLTGLVTRREMERQILLHFAVRERAERMVRKGRAQTIEVEEFSLLFFDLNGLKSVNDSFGHRSGDVLLETFAASLSSFFVRGTDIVCRWGGDEFIVLLGGVTPREKAQRIAEDFLLELDGVTLEFSLENNSGGASHTVPVRAAVGVSSTSDGHRTMEEIITTADKEMYVNKGETCRHRR